MYMYVVLIILTNKQTFYLFNICKEKIKFMYNLLLLTKQSTHYVKIS